MKLNKFMMYALVLIGIILFTGKTEDVNASTDSKALTAATKIELMSIAEKEMDSLVAVNEDQTFKRSGDYYTVFFAMRQGNNFVLNIHNSELSQSANEELSMKAEKSEKIKRNMWIIVMAIIVFFFFSLLWG